MTARAQDDVDRYLRSAVQLYESLDYEEALQQVQRAKQLARGIEHDVAVALHEGIILAALGQEDSSQAAFRRGLTLELKAMLPIKVPPKVERSFEEVRDSVRKTLARSGRAKPPPPPPPPPVELSSGPPAQKPEETKPPPVVATDRPVRVPEPARLETPVSSPLVPYVPAAEARERSRVPVVPVALAGVGAVAAGVGTWFGLQSRSSVRVVEGAIEGGRLPEKSETQALRKHLDDARSQARVANVFFGTAAAAVTGAIVTYLFSGGGTKAETREAR